MTDGMAQVTPRERLNRFWVLVKRTRMYARSTAILMCVLVLFAIIATCLTKRVYRSETTVVYREAVRVGREAENPTQRAARLGPRLKEYLYLRSRLQATIERFDLYPDLVRRSMLDAVDEIQKHILFRTRSPDTFALSFAHESPEIAQSVSTHLAETMIADYTSDNLDSALTTHDVLRSEVESTQKQVEETSRSLAQFLARHPQFTWGLGDSPYAGGQQANATAEAGPPKTEKRVVDRELTRLGDKLREIEAELSGTNDLPLPAPMNTDAQKQRDAAAAALATAESDLEQKLIKVTTAHPDAKIAQARVDRARAALAAAETNLKQSTPPAPQTHEPVALDPARRTQLETQRDALLAQMAARRAGKTYTPEQPAKSPRAGTELSDIVELETEWHKLRLDLERARDAFRKAEDKERTARLQATSAEVEVQESLVITDPAYLPVHPESGRGRVFLAGTIVALFIALGYAAARVLLCDTLFDEGDVLALGSPPLLVSVPHISEFSELFVSPHAPRPTDTPRAPRSRPMVRLARTDTSEDEPLKDERALVKPVSLPTNALHTYVEPNAPGLLVVGPPYEGSLDQVKDMVRTSPATVLGALRVLRHRLEQKRAEQSLVVSILSAGQGEGKTAVALRLALTLAEAERARVVLIEGHLARPQLASNLRLHVPEEMGLTTQLRRRMNGHDGAWNIVRIGASVFAMVEPDPTHVFPETLHSLWFPTLIRELKSAYDYVLIDGCPVLDSGDANVLEEVSDVVVLVARAGQTTGGMVANTVRRIGERRVFGLVLNDEPPRSTI